MNIKQLLSDEEAVSPVIGVILMVAITVILAAVIGTFVLGLGDQVQSSAPNANFQFEFDDNGDTDGFDDQDDSFTVTHNGGQDVNNDLVTIQMKGSEVPSGGVTESLGGDGTWSTGDSVTYSDSGQTDGSDADITSGATIRVVWESSGGGSSNTIGESTVPS